MEDLTKNIIELQETYNISLYPLKQITTDKNQKYYMISGKMPILDFQLII